MLCVAKTSRIFYIVVVILMCFICFHSFTIFRPLCIPKILLLYIYAILRHFDIRKWNENIFILFGWNERAKTSYVDKFPSFHSSLSLSFSPMLLLYTHFNFILFSFLLRLFFFFLHRTKWGIKALTAFYSVIVICFVSWKLVWRRCHCPFYRYRNAKRKTTTERS